MNENAIGSFIKEQRRHIDKTGRQLAKAAGINSGYLSQIESGHARPSPNILEKLSKPLHVPYEMLMIKAGYLKEKSGENKETVIDAILSENIKKLPAKKKEALEKIVESLLEDD